MKKDLLSYHRETTLQAIKVPEGWMTTNQWAEQSDRSISQTNKILRELVQSGHFEVRTFRIAVGSGNRTLNVPHYRETKRRK